MEWKISIMMSLSLVRVEGFIQCMDNIVELIPVSFKSCFMYPNYYVNLITIVNEWFQIS